MQHRSMLDPLWSQVLPPSSGVPAMLANIVLSGTAGGDAVPKLSETPTTEESMQRFEAKTTGTDPGCQDGRAIPDPRKPSH